MLSPIDPTQEAGPTLSTAGHPNESVGPQCGTKTRTDPRGCTEDAGNDIAEFKGCQGAHGTKGGTRRERGTMEVRGGRGGGVHSDMTLPSPPQKIDHSVQRVATYHSIRERVCWNKFQHQRSLCIDTKAVAARTRSGRRRMDAATT
eukprot:757696_1